MMDQFTEAQTCRWSTIIGYLGEAPMSGGCGHCDRCYQATQVDSAGSAEVVDPESVHHLEFGSGTVIQRDGDLLVVRFETHGYRTLSSSVLDEERLLA